MSHERFLSVYTLALAPTHCDSCSYERRAALPINAFFLLRELPNIHDGSSLTDIHTFLQRIRRQGVSNQFAIRQDTAEMATPIAFFDRLKLHVPCHEVVKPQIVRHDIIGNHHVLYYPGRVRSGAVGRRTGLPRPPPHIFYIVYITAASNISFIYIIHIQVFPKRDTNRHMHVVTIFFMYVVTIFFRP